MRQSWNTAPRKGCSYQLRCEYHHLLVIPYAVLLYASSTNLLPANGELMGLRYFARWPHNVSLSRARTSFTRPALRGFRSIDLYLQSALKGARSIVRTWHWRAGRNCPRFAWNHHPANRSTDSKQIQIYNVRMTEIEPHVTDRPHGAIR